MKTAVVIPARYGSTRFPGKPLADVAGRTLIRRVHEIAAAAEGVDLEPDTHNRAASSRGLRRR